MPESPISFGGCRRGFAQFHDDHADYTSLRLQNSCDFDGVGYHYRCGGGLRRKSWRPLAGFLWIADGFLLRWQRNRRHHLQSSSLGSTVLAGEMHVPLGKLGQSPEDAFIFNGDSVFNFARVGGPTVPIVADKRASGNGLVAWGSWHPGVCHFAMSDGSVRGIATTLDTDVLGRICNRADGLPVGSDL